MQVKVTLNPSKGYLRLFQTLLTPFPTLSKGRSAVTLPPIDDGGTSVRCRRNSCKRRSEQPLDDAFSKMRGFNFGGFLGALTGRNRTKSKQNLTNTCIVDLFLGDIFC